MARPAAAPDLSELALSGSPRAMGQAHGEHWREAIAEVCEARIESTLRFAAESGRPLSQAELLDWVPTTFAPHQAYAPAVWEEFEGIAEGAGVPLAELMVGNGLTDLRDAVVYGRPGPSECTVFSALPEATADDTVYVGQTWDMNRSMLPHVFICRREPRDGPATLGVTTAGCLSLIGLNEHGLAVGNSNVTPRDARLGVIYLALIHHALAQSHLGAALNVIVDAERASGHHYYLADDQRVVHLETTATASAEIPRDGSCHTHSNDYRHAGFGDLPAPPRADGRSVERRCQLAAELAARRPLTVDDLGAALAAEGVEVAAPDGEVITCAAAILRPAGRELWATHGPPSRGVWRRYAL